MGAITKRDADITVTIDGIVCQAKFGETILEIARANSLYIPTMCYLSKCESIGACRMCVVEVEGVDGMILSCQEWAVDGTVVCTDSSDLRRERENITKFYAVNHPLECGVCDKSGECDLQNKALEFGLDTQNFSAKEQHRPVQQWGYVSYDPSLCIMCERCVRVSNEITGNEMLQVSSGGYSSTIVNTDPEKLEMSLGESAAVCPVGALVSTDFKYTTNAWELQKIPGSCSHCSGGCQLTYEVKNDTIYRVTNDYEHSTLCSAARYDFGFANTNATKDEKAFDDAIAAFEAAESILFTGAITNEEALILQRLKEQRGYRLVSHEARAYQKFIAAYGSITGKQLYNGDLKTISVSDGIVVLGSRISDDSHQARYHMTMASKRNRAKIIYMHPMEDPALQTLQTQFVKYEVGSEEGVAALLVDTLLSDSDLPEGIRAVLDDLDIGNLSAESNVGEEELEELALSLKRRSGLSLVIGADLYAHPKAENIAKLLALLERYAGFSVVIIPPSTNTLGVALICDLDDEVTGKTIGYNAAAGFVLSSRGDSDLDMPALNQQEGTFTSLDKRVVPTNAAVSYGGYVLNDIATALGVAAKYTIDYTSQLPAKKGFCNVLFDSLPDYFDATGDECRGYLLGEVSIDVNSSIDEVDEVDAYDGIVAYHCDASAVYARYSRPKTEADRHPDLLGSPQFAVAAKLADGEQVSYKIDGVEFQRVFRIDTSMKGTVALNPCFDMGLSTALLFSYRFSKMHLHRTAFEKVED